MKQIFLAFLVCVYCSNGFSQSKLTNSFREINGVKTLNTKSEADGVVQVSLNSSAKASSYKVISSSSKKGVFDLSPQGQKALIKAVNSKTKDESKLIKSLGKSIVTTSSSSPFHIQNTRYIKKVEIDVRDMFRGTERVGRIEELYIKLILEEGSNVQFIGFNNISTKYEVLDFGKIGMTRNQNFTLNAGMEISGTGLSTSSSGNESERWAVVDGDTVYLANTLSDAKEIGNSNSSNVGATFNTSKTVSEERLISKRRIAMKGTISKNEAMIYQEGAPGLNLNDKITIELILETQNNMSDFILNFSGMSNSDGSLRIGADTTKYKLKYAYLTNPQSSLDSIALEYEFTYREVVNKKGKRSVGEWDDKIVYLNANNRSANRFKTPFISQNELKQDIWTIKDAQGNYLYANFHGKLYALKFTQLKSATDFLFWLYQTEYTSFNGTQILAGKNIKKVSPLKQEDKINLFVKRL